MSFGDWQGNISICFISHKQQRYDTAGDWQLEPDGTLHIDISQTGDDKMNFCLMMHEIVESLTYMFKRGFDPNAAKMVDEFDLDMLKTAPDDEPGGDPEAPYYAEHMLASEVENAIIAQVQLDVNKYARVVGALGEDTPDEPTI